MAIFAYFEYIKHGHVGGGGPKCAYVIYEWSLRGRLQTTLTLGR